MFPDIYYTYLMQQNKYKMHIQNDLNKKVMLFLGGLIPILVRT